MKKLFYALLIAIIFSSCATQKHYSGSDITNPAVNGKTIIFTATEASNSTQIVKDGFAIGKLKQQKNIEIFKGAIAELAKETKLDLRYDDATNSNSKEKFVTSDITALRWKFTFSTATMESDIIFTDANAKTYMVTGSFRNGSGGRESKNLHRSFKNALYQFLQQYK